MSFGNPDMSFQKGGATLYPSFHMPFAKVQVFKDLNFHQPQLRAVNNEPDAIYKKYNKNYNTSIEIELNNNLNFDPAKETKYEYHATDHLLMDNLSRPRYTKTNFYDNLHNRRIEAQRVDAPIHYTIKRKHSHTLQPI
jgi:hypothetical protein